MAGELLPDRSRSERQRRIQRVAADDENAARLSRRGRVWCAALCPGGMAALMRISGGMAAALLLLAPLAFGERPSDDENAGPLSCRRRVWCAALRPECGGHAAARVTRGHAARRAGGMAAALLLLAPLAFGDSGVWGERGIVGRFAVRAPFLFAADGRGVSVFDVSTNTPRKVGFVPTADESLDLAVADDLYVVTRGEIARFAIADNGVLTLRGSIPTSDYQSIAVGDGFIATWGTHLTIWSTATETPSVAAELAPHGVISALAFHGSKLWIATQNQAIFGYDLARSAEPAGAIAVGANGIAIRGDTLFAAAGINGLVIADISDITDPRIVSRTGAGEINFMSMVVAGDRAYSASGPNDIQLFDISDLASPQQLAPIHEHTQMLATDGTRLFAGGSDIDAFGLIHVTPQRFAIYDNGARAGSFSEPLQGPLSGVATDGTFAYVADWPNFRVLDISTPSETKEIASIAFDELQDFVKIHNGLAIVWGRAKLNLIDIHDPWHPRLLGTFDSGGVAGGGATFSGDTIVEANPTTGMHFLDFFTLTTPDKPVQIGGVKSHYYEAVSLFPAVYGFDLSGAKVIDATDPHNPQAVNGMVIPHGPAAIAGHTMVVASLDRFHVFDLSDPLKPVETGGAALPAANVAIAADGDGVFVAYAGSVDRLDINNPAHPQLGKTGMKALAPMQIAAGGGKVVIADRYALRVYGEVTPAPQQPPARARAVRH